MIHHRRSIRLKGYDYTLAGFYFITICTHQRQSLFGEIIDGEMRLNSLGRIVQDEWTKTAVIRPEIELGEFVIMPNHIHGIIIIHESVGAYGHTPLQNDPNAPSNHTPQHDESYSPANPSAFRSPSRTIGAVVRGYKSAVTKQVNLLRDAPGVPVWQRNYYEHIIRDEKSHLEIALYILDNPINWQKDSLFTGETP